MIFPDTLLTFALTAALLALAPGPDNIFVLTQSALHGARAGLLVVLGLASGLVVHTTAVALGVAVLIAASATAFTALKLAGAAYLAWLAVQAFRAPQARFAAAAPRLAAARLYRRGLFMNLTNPKVGIFFLAFLPQFTDPARGPVTVQTALLGLTFIAVVLAVFSAIALAAGRLGGWLAGQPRAGLIMNRIAGCVFLALAARIALAER